MTVPIDRIAEVAIVVSDLDRSVRWYNDVLGLEIWDRQKDHATLRLGAGFVGLWLSGAWALKTPSGATLALEGGCRQHFNFWIKNSDGEAALENLKKHGVKFYGPRRNAKGEIHIDFEDPDGHLLEYWGRDSFVPLGPKQQYD